MTAVARNLATPYTVPNLAARWGCSEGLIRKMIDRKQLRAFRLGILIRIPAEEVEKIECQNTPSSDSEGDTHLSGTSTASVGESNSAPRIARARRRKRVVNGRPEATSRGPSDA
ncbi:hypothetical protein Sbs19_29930 [Sphingobium sp. BS19]|nr:hypothetical protein Sbs19_29930 [Sphingobium sp. BS19]